MSTSGAVSGRLWWVINAAVLLVSSFVLTSCTTNAGASASPDKGDIVITVTDLNGKKLTHGVVVRVTGSSQSDGEDNNEFKLESCLPGQYIAAWAPGYQVRLHRCDGISKAYMIPLDSLATIDDHSDYSWLSAIDCSRCHADSGASGPSYNEYNEWNQSGHAKVFQEPYFGTMYIGQTETCTLCHAPAALFASSQTEKLLSFSLSNVYTEGITCDVCHKVNAVLLENNQYPFDNAPGIRSLQLVRADAFTLGSFSNIRLTDPSFGDTNHSMCSRIFSKSEFCAACHYGRLGNILIYSAYKEWKGSSYAQNPSSAQYRTCQDCHMSYMKNDVLYPFSRRDACSETDEGFQDFNHNVMDWGWDPKSQRNIPRMIPGAASIQAIIEYKPEKNNAVQVQVAVTNVKAGHKFPTDSPLRQLILVVDAKDQFSNALMPMGDGRIPNWGGIPGLGRELSDIKPYGGQPGKIFANLIVQADSQLDQDLAYWDQGLLTPVTNGGTSVDNRLEPGRPDLSNYYFALPPDGEVKFTISLFYRFAPYDLIQRMYPVNNPERTDVLVAVLECLVNVFQTDHFDCR